MFRMHVLVIEAVGIFDVLFASRFGVQVVMWVTLQSPVPVGLAVRMFSLRLYWFLHIDDSMGFSRS
jgi:hypothetical protein